MTAPLVNGDSHEAQPSHVPCHDGLRGRPDRPGRLRQERLRLLGLHRRRAHRRPRRAPGRGHAALRHRHGAGELERRDRGRQRRRRAPGHEVRRPLRRRLGRGRQGDAEPRLPHQARGSGGQWQDRGHRGRQREGHLGQRTQVGLRGHQGVLRPRQGPQLLLGLRRGNRQGREGRDRGQADRQGHLQLGLPRLVLPSGRHHPQGAHGRRQDLQRVDGRRHQVQQRLLRRPLQDQELRRVQAGHHPGAQRQVVGRHPQARDRHPARPGRLGLGAGLRQQGDRRPGLHLLRRRLPAGQWPRRRRGPPEHRPAVASHHVQRLLRSSGGQGRAPGHHSGLQP